MYLNTRILLVDKTFVVNLKQYLSTILSIGDFNSSVLDSLSAYLTYGYATEYLRRLVPTGVRLSITFK